MEDRQNDEHGELEDIGDQLSKIESRLTKLNDVTRDLGDRLLGEEPKKDKKGEEGKSKASDDDATIGVMRSQIVRLDRYMVEQEEEIRRLNRL